MSDASGGVNPLRPRGVRWSGTNRSLDVGALNAAAARLLGEHDFAAFCKKREGATTIRELQRLEWVREPDGYGAGGDRRGTDAFCHSMVRALVGSLLAAGDGSRPVGGRARCMTRAVRDSGGARRARARTVPGGGRLPGGGAARRAGPRPRGECELASDRRAPLGGL
ncbi:hypothetical protein [Nonomuraea helvata]|uniref:hypothetical protein n=1 Tax=Nonomuraea helvata TaxID=37484 RepID=UPI003CD06146